MTDQEKREKVIKGLECCLGKGQKRGMCEDCPYDSNTGRMKCNLGDMHVDALALLKAQEPCEDAVSRKDVINVLQSPCDMRYVNGNWHPCIGDYIEAITNLSAVAPKAQEPRVMTFEEVKACKVMWIEEREDGEDENGEPFEKMMSWAIPMQLEEDDPDMIAYCVGSFTGYMRSNYDYGLGWRCWTSEPTDAQREAVDWE